MIEPVIQNISNNSIQSFFSRTISSFKPVEESFGYLLEEEKYAGFSEVWKLGEANYDNSDELLVFSCKYEGELSARSSKKKQFDIAKKVLKEDFKDGAIFVFYDESGKFRFSFIRKNYGDQDQKFTPWRRYTYFVDPKNQNKTFSRRVGACGFKSLDEIQESFSVEPLSKEFYKALSRWYFWSLTQVEFPNDTDEEQNSLLANSMIRLITRLIFVWFMKQKKLVPNDFFELDKIDELINYNDKTGSTYYKAILQNLFFATLNTPKEKGRQFVHRQYGVQSFYRYKRFIKDEDRFLSLMENVPFLNGGLFENLDSVDVEKKSEIRIDCFSDRAVNEERLKVPDYLFFGKDTANLNDYLGSGNEKVSVTGLIDLLNQYDFTIDENTPFDQEVALDPELLGLVFENLLASYNPETQTSARKESGSFYTPRSVVDFMVEESLINYTKDKTHLEASKLRQLFKNNDTQPFEDYEDRKELVKALSEVKILDPACGSGAFPMGALQKMVHALALLDSENKLWYERQKTIAIEETTVAFDIGDHEERKQRLETIEQAFEEKTNAPDYARKLYLIENALFGVDIQPIAMQIAKLRFFISLLVDQNVDTGRENMGILALPNMETKFVAANTLIGLPGIKNGQFVLKDRKLEELEKELNTIRHELFNARTTRTKEKKRKRHIEIQEEIGEVLVQNGFPNTMAEAIKEWKAFNPNNKADWFDPEWMFGIPSFDIVIGNPPYIQLQKAISDDDKLKYADLYKNEGYVTFERTGDIYALFYEKGIKLLKKAGWLCYITSNKWMRTKYGASLRQFFTTKNPELLIDLGPGVFEAATVDTNILLIQNKKVVPHNMRALKLKSKEQITAPKEEDTTLFKHCTNDSWVILQPEEQALKNKIEQQGIPLKKWDLNINRGVLTGYNKAFIIDGETKDRLIAEDPKSGELLKPILRGKDIKKYQPEFADLWLIATFPASNINIGDYSAIKNYLEAFLPKIKQEGIYFTNSKGKREKTRKKTSNEWYETQDQIAYKDEFEKPKIIYPNMTKYLPFVYDKRSFYTNQKCFILTGNQLGYLTAFFNSLLFKYVYRDNFPELQGGTRELSKIYFENIYVKPLKDDNLSEKFEKLVSKISELSKKSDEFRELNNQLNEVIFKTYDLSSEEIQQIKKFKF
ncbi:MAG: TaqI-like C-terminal specificity domain-containing protein [Balneola sp.]